MSESKKRTIWESLVRTSVRRDATINVVAFGAAVAFCAILLAGAYYLASICPFQ